MTATTDDGAPRASAPWHLWVVGLLSLAWNAFGCYDYTCTNVQGEAYMRQMGMTDAQIGYFNSLPAWMTGVWAVGVWGGALGSVLLLLRSKWALHVFVLSFAAFMVSVVYAFGVAGAFAVMGMQTVIMDVVIGAACLLFIWYARAMTAKGVLR